MLGLVVLPMQVGQQILRLLERVSDVALRDPELMRHDGRDEVAIRVVADDEIGPRASELREKLALRVDGIALEVRPDLEARDPLRDDLPALVVAKRHAKDARVFRPEDRFDALVTRCPVRLRDQSRDDDDLRLDVEALLVDRLAHLALQGADLIEDIDDLPAGIRFAEDVGLPEIAMGRNDRDREDHWHPRQKALEIPWGRGFEDVEQELHRLADALRRSPPAGLEAEPPKLTVEGVALLRVRFEQRGRLIQGFAELVDVPKRPVQHQLLPANLVHLQEVEQELLTAPPVQEQPSRQMPVEELDAAPDVARILELGEAALERAQVDLEHIAVAGRYAGCDAFLDIQKFRDGELPAAHVLGVHLHVLPTPDAHPHREADERFVHHGLLRVPHDRRHPAFEERCADLRLAELLVVVYQIGPQQELPVHRLQSSE